MINLRGNATMTWHEDRLDGVVRDDRQAVPDDGKSPGVSLSMGDPMGGPALMLSITRRLYPKKAPVHKHKSDTFRMALGESIVVGRRSYAHGEFRLQAVDTFYGPELWSDEVGTNQLLVMADRRGGKPYLTTPELQALSDMGKSAEAELGEGYRQHPAGAAVAHEIRNNFGATLHAGHWDAGFTDTSLWPTVGDGTRLGVIAMGPVVDGPLFLCWDRSAAAPELTAFTAGTDLLQLVVEGSVVTPSGTVPRLGFRVHREGATVEASCPGPEGARELWLFADRRHLPGLGHEADAQIAGVAASRVSV